jgi:membrane protein DedA with SNARE-associated domain
MYLTPNVRRAVTVAHRRVGEPSAAQERVAKPGFTRCGSAVCGVLGFEQHLGLAMALAGGVGWLIGSDHVSFLLRRRYGAWAGAHLKRRQPNGRVDARVVSLLRGLVVLPRHLATTPYRVFALINLVSATGWGIAFVWTGYLLAHSWNNGQPRWNALAALLTTVAAIIWIDHIQRRGAYRRRPRRGRP